MTYAEKLRSPNWQKKRLAILNRDNWQCCSCHRGDLNLQVHHLIYARRDPWDYPDDVFQTLCEPCHTERQELTDKAANALRMALAKIPTQRLEVVAQRLIAEAFAEMNT
jgi:5-methylcytosine-specific restriction endonuclease McrA